MAGVNCLVACGRIPRLAAGLHSGPKPLAKQLGAHWPKPLAEPKWMRKVAFLGCGQGMEDQASKANKSKSTTAQRNDKKHHSKAKQQKHNSKAKTWRCKRCMMPKRPRVADCPISPEGCLPPLRAASPMTPKTPPIML